MPKHSLTKSGPVCLVMATLSEAKPFITGLPLVQKEDTPFPVFTGSGIVLVVCGIGKANAAMGTTYCCLEFYPTVVINLGAAGATDNLASLGECFHVSKIFEFDRPSLRTGTPHLTKPDTIKNFNAAPIATQDRPILLPAEREEVARLARLVDMEAAGVAQACKKFGVKCLIFKFVSDTPEHTEGNNIVSHIKKFRTSFYNFFNQTIFPLVSGK